MRIGKLTALAGILLGGTLTAAAQEKGAPEQPPIEAAPPVVEIQVAPCAPELCCPPSDKPGVKILWLEHERPITRLVGREVITEKKFTTLEVQYRTEKRCVTDVVLKPKEVVKEETCTVMKPVEEIDPHTGQCCTVLKPCTETKLVKETCFVAVAEPRTIEVQVPFLKPVEKIVLSRNTVFEYRTEMKKEGCAIPTCDVVPVPRFFVAPQLPCNP